MEFRVCSGEIPPCSFETARRLLWRNTNNELLPVYDRQLCEWYLQTQILRCECLGDNKWLLISLKSEFVTQIWGKSTAFPQIWVTNSDLSDQLKFEWNRLVSPRFEWTLKFERSPRIEGITSDHPELSASPNFEGGHLPVYRGVPGCATDCPCGVWCRGLTICLLYVGQIFGNLF